MSTEETSVQMKIDRAWTTPLPTEPTARLKHGSDHQHLQAQRPQSQGLNFSISKVVIAVILWTGFGVALYFLFTT